MRFLILQSGQIIKDNMEHIDTPTFWRLKPGDRVMTASGPATVIEGPTMVNEMAKLKCDKPKWNCPHFYQREIKSVI